MGDKIIHSFQARRQVSQAFSGLAETTNETELIRRARELVHQHEKELVLAELLRRLNTPSSQLRGGLGHVAALLPADEVTQALRAAAADRENSPQLRITAALVLERFLGQELPAGVMSDLDQNNEVAMQSLREAIEESAKNRHILLEYVVQMRQTEVGVALMVVDMLSRLPPHDQVELLRIIAHDTRGEVARVALQHLEQLGATEAAQSAARALHILTYTLPPELELQATRSLRKLLFSGVRYVPPAPQAWHSLLSPADIAGNQTVWFVQHPPDAKMNGVLLGFVLNPTQGVLQFFGSETIARSFLPAAPGLGKQILVEIGGPQPLLMLQAPYDYGRWLVQRSLASHWQAGRAQPLPAEFELYSDLIWEYDEPVPPPALLAYFEATADAPAGRDEAEIDTIELAKFAGELLYQPTTLAWYAQFRAGLAALGFHTDATFDSADEDELKRVLLQVLQTLEQLREAEGLLQAIPHALRTQAAWLHAAGDEVNARRAYQLAAYAPHGPLAQHPVVVALVAGSLRQMSQRAG